MTPNNSLGTARPYVPQPKQVSVHGNKCHTLLIILIPNILTNPRMSNDTIEQLSKLLNPVPLYYFLLFYIPIFPRNNNHELRYDIRKEGKLTESNYKQ